MAFVERYFNLKYDVDLSKYQVLPTLCPLSQIVTNLEKVFGLEVESVTIMDDYSVKGDPVVWLRKVKFKVEGI